MIGFYDYTVVLTYMSLACSVFGITEAIQGNYVVAVVCLALSGLFDMFDGKIARTKKNRTDDERLFGVQIDSLCDVVCFGVFPAVIFYTVAPKGIVTTLVLVYYCICSVIRLAYFNVLETNRQKTEGGANKYYFGLPITSISIILPIMSILKPFLAYDAFLVVLSATIAATGTLFIVNFQIKKPSNRKLAALVSLTACVLLAFLVCTHIQLKQSPYAEKNTIIETFKHGVQR